MNAALASVVPAGPVHPLRLTVFAPRVGAYLTAAALLCWQAAPGAPLVLLCLWCLLIPWLLRGTVPTRFHPALRCLENLTLPTLALFAGAPVVAVAATSASQLLGLLTVHGLRAGFECVLAWALVVLPLGWLLEAPLQADDPGVAAGLGLAASFALLVAALSNVRTRRLAQSRQALAKRARSEAALARQLARYVPSAVCRDAREADGGGHRSRRRWLTVCFADLAGFTALTDAGESEEVVTMLDDFYAAMTEAALMHGGTIDKFIGDAVMVFFGDEADADRRADARACVDMALGMQCRFDDLRARWRRAGVVRDLDLRIGMHSGWCTVGVFGPAQRRSYTVIGTTVNTASRLETGAQPGQILMSRATWLLLDDRAGRCRRFGTLSAKGLKAPIDTFVVLRDAPDAPLLIELDGLQLRLEPGVADPLEARAALERALGALSVELAAPRPLRASGVDPSGTAPVRSAASTPVREARWTRS